MQNIQEISLILQNNLVHMKKRTILTILMGKKHHTSFALDWVSSIVGSHDFCFSNYPNFANQISFLCFTLTLTLWFLGPNTQPFMFGGPKLNIPLCLREKSTRTVPCKRFWGINRQITLCLCQ